jgi:ATP-dependent Lon protease
MSKKETNKSKRKDESKQKKKNNESSDDSESFYTDDDSENEMDVHEYRKFLKNIFPSKHLDKKIKSGEKVKELLNKCEEEEENEAKSKNNKKPKIHTESKNKKEQLKPTKYKKGKKIVVSEDDEEEDETEEYLDSEDTETDEDEEDEDDEYNDDDNNICHNNECKNKNAKPSKFNIVFTISGQEDEMEDMSDDDEEWESCSDDVTENEDDPISSDSDTNDELEEEDENEEEAPRRSKRIAKLSNKDTKHKNKKNEEKNEDKNEDKTDKNEDKNETILINKLKDALGVKSAEKKDTEEEDIVKLLKDLQSKNKHNELVNECLKVCEGKLKDNKRRQEKKIEKEKARNGRIFKRILRDKNTMNDFEFYDKIDTVNQKKIIKELKEINKITRIEKPYRLTLLESDIPLIFKAAAMKKISSLRYMEPGSGEYYKIKNWVDTFMRIPFNEYKTLPISITDGVDNCHDFMANAQKILDEAVYGLNDAKMQIMQMLGQLITNPKAIGSAIAINGPPGTGKTSLVKEGISKILNRPFAFIALGGATDSSFLEGHGYTYEGSTWGKIVQILIDSKCMNPVIYFDELDKISDTPKGEEIAGILTHLTDTSQNSQFHDKYFTEIDFDLSKCLFIFSYNDESKINPILKDRMYRIQTKGYNQKQKAAISNNYLLPKIREQVKFTAEDIIIPEQTIHYIIDNYCNKEEGVRNLKRCLEIIYTKLNLYRLMRPGSNLFEEDMSIKVEFPFTVTKTIVEKLIKSTGNGLDSSLYHLYI